MKFRQIQTAMAERAASFQPPPEAVTTIVAKGEEWPSTLNVDRDGRRRSGRDRQRGPRRASSIGSCSIPAQSVKEGDVLVHLDTRQEQAQLAAAEAQRDLAQLNFNRMQGLVSSGAVSRAEYDLAEAEHKQSDARVGEIRATIERKTIRAPFSGVLGLRQVNLGQYLDGRGCRSSRCNHWIRST